MKMLERIKLKFKDLFKRNTKVLESKGSEFEESISKDEEKREFFELYKNVKSGKVKKENLMIHDLIKIEIMLMKEKEYNDNKVKEIEEKIRKIESKKI